MANLFDPAGLITPISAKYKLDLHELCTLHLDWDNEIPHCYLELFELLNTFSTKDLAEFDK